jgi:hypothetical protein
VITKHLKKLRPQTANVGAKSAARGMQNNASVGNLFSPTSSNTKEIESVSTFTGIRAIGKVGTFVKKLRRPMTGNNVSRRNALMSPCTHICDHDHNSKFSNIFSARPGSSTTKSSLANRQSQIKFDFHNLKCKVRAKEYKSSVENTLHQRK